MGFWDFFWLLIWTFVFVAYLMVLFQIIADLFRDPELGGGAKALWCIGLLFIPWLVALIYLIVRGKGMAQRHMLRAQRAQESTDRYIQSVAGGSNATEQIASAKALLDNGTINQAEFDQIKAKALA
jgi:hypothetical protein